MVATGNPFPSISAPHRHFFSGAALPSRTPAISSKRGHLRSEKWVGVEAPPHWAKNGNYIFVESGHWQKGATIGWQNGRSSPSPLPISFPVPQSAHPIPAHCPAACPLPRPSIPIPFTCTPGQIHCLGPISVLCPVACHCHPPQQQMPLPPLPPRPTGPPTTKFLSSPVFAPVFTPVSAPTPGGLLPVTFCNWRGPHHTKQQAKARRAGPSNWISTKRLGHWDSKAVEKVSSLKKGKERHANCVWRKQNTLGFSHLLGTHSLSLHQWLANRCIYYSIKIWGS